MVFLQLEGQKVPDWAANKPRYRSWILEDDRERQGDISWQFIGVGWDEENSGVLHGKSSQGRENQLGDA